MATDPHSQTGNGILDGLSRDTFRRIAPHLQHLALPLRHHFSQPNQPSNGIYFLTEGIASVVAPFDDGTQVEVGFVGSEGFVGIPAFLGDAAAHDVDVYMQVAGSGFRLSAHDLQEEMKQGSAFRESLLRYVQFFLAQVSQSFAIPAKAEQFARAFDGTVLAHALSA